MISDSSLLWAHGSAAVFHFIQSGYAFGLTNSIYKDKGLFTITNADHKLPSYRLGNLVGVFPLLAAVDHAWSAADSKRYLSYVNKGFNPARWIEYAGSAGLMFFIISQLSEINDIKLLSLITGSNIMLQYFGYSSERNAALNHHQQAQSENKIGFFSFMLIWVPILTSFFTALQDSEEDPPGAVYSIIFIMFALFLLFGLLNSAYVRGRCSKVSNSLKMKEYNFRRVEMGYLILSFVSKTLLTNLTLFGALTKPIP